MCTHTLIQGGRNAPENGEEGGGCEVEVGIYKLNLKMFYLYEKLGTVFLETLLRQQVHIWFQTAH